MPTLRTNDLSEFVRVIDEEYGGNLNAPGVAERFYPMELEFSTKVNQNLDPFSIEYYNNQLRLYEEIAGRALDQWSGELHPVDVASLAVAANPLGITNAGHVSEHVRALAAMLKLSDLGETPQILDMGAGHGLSSELFAFCGCQVSAVDIDPELTKLSNQRSAARSLKIKRYNLNYDDLSMLPEDRYEAAFFFQSLHHSLRPWELIRDLHSKLVSGGLIAFTGEPIDAPHWKHWGLRMDQESIYVARKFGWFESGWSHEFIRQCFSINGYALTFFSGGHGGGEIAIASADATKVQAAETRAAAMGLTVRFPVCSGLPGSPATLHCN